MKTLFYDELSKREQPENFQKLATHINRLVKKGRNRTGEYYSQWDDNLDVYRGKKCPTLDDVEAEAHGEPSSMLVQTSFAQVQTFVAFAYTLLGQNRRWTEFEATGMEDHKLVDLAELTVDRDLRRCIWPQVLVQNLTDVARFTYAPLRTLWSHETIPHQAATDINTTAEYINPGASVGPAELTVYEGNRITNVSPYRFYTDHRYPLARWMEGQYVAEDSEEFKYDLIDQDKLGEVAGAKHITKHLNADQYRDRGKSRLTMVENYTADGGTYDDNFPCATTVVELRVNPKEHKLSDIDRQQLYRFKLANDERIIGIYIPDEPHAGFSYDLGLFLPDMHQKINQSLADICDPLQGVISYLINTRLESVRKSLANQAVIVPDVIDADSLQSRSPWIFAKQDSALARLGVKSFYQQIQHVDVTAAHIQDAEMLMKIQNMITGVNENAMGQFHSGRRSATEAKSVSSGAAARMGLAVSLLFAGCYNPTYRKTYLNQRHKLSIESWRKIHGPSKDDMYMEFHQPYESLVGNEDMFVFDSTTPSEKGYLAQSLQELFTVLASNPETAQMYGIDLQELLREVYTLRGVRNTERFYGPPTIPQASPPNPQGTNGAEQSIGQQNPLALLQGGAAGRM